MDKLVEEMARAICEASGQTWRSGTYRVASGPNFEIENHPLDPFNNHWRHAAQACAAIAQKRVNELEALVEQMGGGCDANCGGLHSAMQQGREWFCPDCGLMLKRVAYVLPHVKPAVARAALPTMLKGNGDG